MDSRDEELTLENVDEQVEQYLSRPQAVQPPTRTSLTYVAQGLQSIYEKERLEQVWARINDSMPAIHTDNILTIQPAGEQSTIHAVQREKTVLSDANTQNFSVIQNGHRSTKQVQKPFRRNKWYGLSIGLVAAIILITLLTWPMLSYILRNPQIGSSRTPTKTVTSQPTVNTSNMKEYDSQYFKIKNPANWAITATNTKVTGSYLQKVQFQPATTSSVFMNVEVLPGNSNSTTQLLHGDSDVKLGTLTSTRTVTYNGRSWLVGIIELAGSTPGQTGKLEVAYSNQGSPYRIEFGATSGMFSAYENVFNSMFASFYAQNKEPKTVTTGAPTPTPIIASTIAPTPTPITIPTATPLPISTPSPIANVPGIKVYIGLYFTIQYPANWVITNVTTGGIYQQTVQFRPSATSAIFVNVNVMYSSSLSSVLLLLVDPAVKLGTLLSMNTVTYNGLPWTVGIVNLLGTVQAQPSEEEIAYSNQNAPYKIELSAPQDKFGSYETAFNTMLASFSPAN